MGRFLFKTCLLLFLTLGVYWSYYQWRVIENFPDEKFDYYIWGDSQTIQALDLYILSAKANATFYSWATHGGGIYDLACFVNRVPDGSNVIIGIGSPLYLTPVSRDYNKSTLDLTAVFELIKMGYPLGEIKQIFEENYRPAIKFPKSKHYSEEVVRVSDKSDAKELENLYGLGESHWELKLDSIIASISKLKRKNCEIIILEMPVSTHLKEIENKSKFFSKVLEFREQIENKVDGYHVLMETSSDDDFYDMTHLNLRGSIKFSEGLASYLLGQN